MIARIRYSVVVPVYRNCDSIGELIGSLAEMNAARGHRLEAVFVVDGSPDNSAELLRVGLRQSSLSAQLVSLSRNFGSFSAIRVGLAVAAGEYVAVMAADLQEPPDVISAFFNSLEAGECDIAIGQRTGRDDPAMSSAAARLYWAAYRRVINPAIPAGGVDIFGCTREVARQIAAFREAQTSLVGLIYWAGYRRRTFSYHRRARAHGTSAWTMRGKIRYMSDSIYAFTDLPILLLQAIGLIGMIASTLLGIVIFLVWLAGGIPQPGYTPMMIAILASTSALLLGLGVVGSYVARAYENSKARPIALVAGHEVFGDAEDTV